MKSLGKIIKNKTGAKNLEALTKLIKKAPYSQPIQKLGKELSMDDSADILLRYDWTVNTPKVEAEDKNAESIHSMGSLKYKKAKKKKADKKKLSIKSKSEKDNNNPKTDKKKKKVAKSAKSKKKAKSPIKSENPKVLTSFNIEKVIADRKAITPKSKVKAKSKKKTEKLDDYTVWLNSLKKDNVSDISKPKKSKSKKEKTKKKKKKHSVLKQKIDTSVKVNDKIASKSLAKLYAKEGHYKKAIKVYKALSLKNPKKSSSFAEQIQKLKDKLS